MLKIFLLSENFVAGVGWSFVYSDYFIETVSLPRKINIDSCGSYEPCGECNLCSCFCDVCGYWLYKDEPCELH